MNGTASFDRRCSIEQQQRAAAADGGSVRLVHAIFALARRRPGEVPEDVDFAYARYRRRRLPPSEIARAGGG